MTNENTASDQKAKKAGGKLTIFASYLSGTGKSFAMLRAAEEARRAGRDVVIGLLTYVGRRQRPWRRSLRRCPAER